MSALTWAIIVLTAGLFLTTLWLATMALEMLS